MASHSHPKQCRRNSRARPRVRAFEPRLRVRSHNVRNSGKAASGSPAYQSEQAGDMDHAQRRRQRIEGDRVVARVLRRHGVDRQDQRRRWNRPARRE